MDTCWSYRHVRPEIDVGAELLAARGDEPDPTLRDLTVATLRVSGKFPDGHAAVRDWRNLICPTYLPAVARNFEPESQEVGITLADKDGGDAKTFSAALSRRRDSGRPRPWLDSPAVEKLQGIVPPMCLRAGNLSPEMLEQVRQSHGGRRTLDGGIGYVQLTDTDDAPGLVIDVRGNGGGSRLPLLMLWPYLADPGEPPRVVTLARPILGPDAVRSLPPAAAASSGAACWRFPTTSTWSSARWRVICQTAACSTGGSSNRT